MPPDNRRKVPNMRLIDGEKIDNLPANTIDDIQQVQSNLTSHEANTSNPHSVTKEQVGLDFVTNTGSPSEALFWDGVYRVPLGEGDVVWTSTSTDQNIAVFDWATGKLIEDGGIAKDTLALICNDQHSITDYTFTGSERRNGGYLCTTPSANTTINIDADLFVTGTEFLFCKGTNNSYTITLDAGGGNNINGSQTLVLDIYNEFVQLIKDGANTWKAIQTVPKSTINWKANLSGATFTGNVIVRWISIAPYIDNPIIELDLWASLIQIWWHNDVDRFFISNTNWWALFEILNDRFTFNKDIVVNWQNWTSAWTSYTPVFSWSGWGTAGSPWTSWFYKVIWKTCHVYFTWACDKNTLSWRPRLSLPITPLRDGSECTVPALLWGIWDRLSTQIWDAVLSWWWVEWISWILVAWDWSSYPSTVYVRWTFSYEIA